jgi:hypothetical protein
MPMPCAAEGVRQRLRVLIPACLADLFQVLHDPQLEDVLHGPCPAIILQSRGPDGGRDVEAHFDFYRGRANAEQWSTRQRPAGESKAKQLRSLCRRKSKSGSFEGVSPTAGSP